MNYKIKKLIFRSGYIWGYGFMLLILYTFIKAYLNPSKQVIVAINDFGEMYLEIACFIFVVPIMTYGLYLAIRNYK